MEDYERFVEFHLSQLKRSKDVEEDKTKSPSLICFYGRPILSPLLSEPQREEMGRLREAAQKAAHPQKCKDDPRMALLHTILHSVQIRKTPTLEELLKETDVQSGASSDTDKETLLQNIFANNSECHSFNQNEKLKETLQPLTSTTCSALLASQVQPLTSCSKNSPSSCHVSHSGSRLWSPHSYCQPSSSSGYDSFMNVDNTISAMESHRGGEFLSGNGEIYEGDFSRINSSDTVKKMPDIINHPPIDGEELEDSGQEISLIAENPERSSFVECSSEGESTDVFTEHKETSHLSNQGDSLQEMGIECGLKDEPKDVPAFKCLTQTQTEPFETVQTDEEDLKPPEEPYRISLQTLLKKSQDYRRNQRMLRSQAKNAKIQDRTQDQPKSEEQSLSDKENDEQHNKVADSKKNQELSDTLSITGNQLLKRSNENNEKSEEINDISLLTIDIEVQDHIIMADRDSYDSVTINNQVNTSGHKSVSLSAPIWTENTNKSIERSASTSPKAFKDVRKYHKIPAPNFCRSPVSCKVKRPSPTCDKSFPAEVGINMPMDKAHKVKQNSSSTSPLNMVVDSDVTSVLAKSSQHIDQLEFNLSGLKVLISDLEFTLTESIDKDSSQSESQQMQLSQNNAAGWFSDAQHSQSSQSANSIKSCIEKSLQMERTTETIDPQENQLVTSTGTSREMSQARLTHAQNTRKTSSAKCILSAAQRMLIPDVFRKGLPEATTQTYVPVLSDKSNDQGMLKIDSDSRSTSLNQSYNVEAPSELWLQRECGSQRCEKYELTPESGSESQGVSSKVKRRLRMTEDLQEKEEKQEFSEGRPSSSTPKAAARRQGGLGSVAEREARLRQIHSAQIRALQEEHQRQQEQLLQALAARYRALHSVSLPYSVSTSRLGDTVTFPPLSQPSPCPLPERYRHLLSAAAKGFLTRRLLKTERVAQLVRTVRDTLQFLKAFHQQCPNKVLCSRQDLMLQERVSLQLRATRYEIYDIFSSLSVVERMQLIRLDRDLVRERELKRQNGAHGQPKGKSSLSAATQKSLERKGRLIIQKKTAERQRGASARTLHKPGFSAEQPLETRAGQFRANPQRVPKSTYTSRPR